MISWVMATALLTTTFNPFKPKTSHSASSETIDFVDSNYTLSVPLKNKYGFTSRESFDFNPASASCASTGLLNIYLYDDKLGYSLDSAAAQQTQIKMTGDEFAAYTRDLAEKVSEDHDQDFDQLGYPLPPKFKEDAVMNLAQFIDYNQKLVHGITAVAHQKAFDRMDQMVAAQSPKPKMIKKTPVKADHIAIAGADIKMPKPAEKLAQVLSQNLHVKDAPKKHQAEIKKLLAERQALTHPYPPFYTPSDKADMQRRHIEIEKNKSAKAKRDMMNEMKVLENKIKKYYAPDQIAMRRDRVAEIDARLQVLKTPVKQEVQNFERTGENVLHLPKLKAVSLDSAAYDAVTPAPEKDAAPVDFDMPEDLLITSPEAPSYFTANAAVERAGNEKKSYSRAWVQAAYSRKISDQMRVNAGGAIRPAPLFKADNNFAGGKLDGDYTFVPLALNLEFDQGLGKNAMPHKVFVGLRSEFLSMNNQLSLSDLKSGQAVQGLICSCTGAQGEPTDGTNNPMFLKGEGLYNLSLNAEYKSSEFVLAVGVPGIVPPMYKIGAEGQNTPPNSVEGFASYQVKKGHVIGRAAAQLRNGKIASSFGAMIGGNNAFVGAEYQTAPGYKIWHTRGVVSFKDKYNVNDVLSLSLSHMTGHKFGLQAGKFDRVTFSAQIPGEGVKLPIDLNLTTHVQNGKVFYGAGLSKKISK